MFCEYNSLAMPTDIGADISWGREIANASPEISLCQDSDFIAAVITRVDTEGSNKKKFRKKIPC